MEQIPESGGPRAEALDGSFVVIAAFNEAAVVRETVESVLSLGAHVVVVDDASTDDSSERLRDLPIHLLRHSANLGQGAALQTGIDYALERGARYIVTFDADGQHHAEDIPRLLNALVEKSLDVVIGSRFLGKAVNLKRGRRLLLKAAVLFTSACYGMRLTDAHNGLRAFRAPVARNLRLRQHRMAHASEFLRNIRASRLRYAEVPCTVSYTSYSLAKGQGALGAVDILYDLFMRFLAR